MTTATLYLLCGLPGAGKTTCAQQILDGTKAVYLSPDEWVTSLGMSLVDYGFRFKLQDRLLMLAGRILACGASTVVEFGSWSREERETIRQVAVREGAASELHFLDAPHDELVERVRSRGGPEADDLAAILDTSSNFERPTEDEIALFDRYVGPADPWPSR